MGPSGPSTMGVKSAFRTVADRELSGIVVVAQRNSFGFGGTEFSGGRLTGPILDALDIGSLCLCWHWCLHLCVHALLRFWLSWLLCSACHSTSTSPLPDPSVECLAGNTQSHYKRILSGTEARFRGFLQSQLCWALHLESADCGGAPTAGRTRLARILKSSLLSPGDFAHRGVLSVTTIVHQLSQ